MEPQNISIAEKAWLEWQRSSNSQDGCSRVVFSNDGRDYEIDFVSMKQLAFVSKWTWPWFEGVVGGTTCTST